MEYGVMLKSTTTDLMLYYAHVPKGYNRWQISKDAAYRFKSKKEAEDFALNLYNKEYGDETRAMIVVTELE